MMEIHTKRCKLELTQIRLTGTLSPGRPASSANVSRGVTSDQIFEIVMEIFIYYGAIKQVRKCCLFCLILSFYPLDMAFKVSYFRPLQCTLNAVKVITSIGKTSKYWKGNQEISKQQYKDTKLKTEQRQRPSVRPNLGQPACHQGDQEPKGNSSSESSDVNNIYDVR